MAAKSKASGQPLPHFVLKAQPRTIDATLLKMPDDTWISCSENFAGRDSYRTTEAKRLREDIREVIARQARGFYLLREAAQAVADAQHAPAPPIDASKLLSDMLDAFAQGELIVRDPATQLPRRKHERIRDFWDWVTPADMDEWFEATRVAYRFPGAQDEAKRQSEEGAQRQCRRYERFLALGGKVERKADGKWNHSGGIRGALAALAREEAAAMRPYRDPRDVASDIDAEAERRRSSLTIPRA